MAAHRRARLGARPGRAAARARRHLHARRPGGVSLHRADDRGAGAGGRGPRDRARHAARAATARCPRRCWRPRGSPASPRAGGWAARRRSRRSRTAPPTIRRVDKIVGPGNVYVALAKRRGLRRRRDRHGRRARARSWSSRTRHADPALIAADLLAQAEHDPDGPRAAASPTRRPVAAASQAALDAPAAPRCRAAAIAAAVAGGHGAVVVAADLDDAVDLANRLAPEHLELLVAVPAALLPRVRRAGAVFLGPHTPEVVGDYVAGPEPRAAHRRHRALRVAARHRRFREALERDRVLGVRACAAALPHLARAGAGRGAPTRHARGGSRVRDGTTRGARSAMSRCRAAGPRRAQDQGDGDRRSSSTSTAPGSSKIETPHPVLQPHAGGVVQARPDGSGRRGHAATSRWTSTTRWKTSASCSARRCKQALGDKRGHRPLRRRLRADGRGAGPGLGRSLGPAVPRLQRAGGAHARVATSTSTCCRSSSAPSPSTRRSPCTSPCTTATICTTSPRPSSSRWAAPGRGHAAQPAHRRRAALDQGRTVRAVR